MLHDESPRPSRRALEDELNELILYSQGKRQQQEDRAEMRTRVETVKIILPWLCAIGMFLWTASGEWTHAKSATQRVSDLEQKVRQEYVTKDDFKHVADDVRDIKQFLMGRGGNPQPRLQP